MSTLWQLIKGCPIKTNQEKTGVKLFLFQTLKIALSYSNLGPRHFCDHYLSFKTCLNIKVNITKHVSFLFAVNVFFFKQTSAFDAFRLLPSFKGL